MSEFVISKDQFIQTKKVKIDGVGSLEIRRLGAGEGLDLGLKLHRRNQIIAELQALDIGKLKTPDDAKELDKYEDKLEKLMEEANEIRKYEYDLYRKCIITSSKKVDDFLNSLSIEGIQIMINQVFAAKQEASDE